MALTHLAAASTILGRPLTSQQLDAFTLFSELLLQWNTKINVTAIRESLGVETLHFVDSLAALPALPAFEGPRVVDIGSGGGLPGLALRVARPDLALTLVDSIAKKVRVMNEIATGLGLAGDVADGVRPVELIAARAEELGQRKGMRESFDVALARAVGATAVVAELTLPLVKVGGEVLLWKKRDIDDELAEAEGAIRKLGGKVTRRMLVDLPGLPADRQIIGISKIAPTPARYPRTPGTPAKEPLT